MGANAVVKKSTKFGVFKSKCALLLAAVESPFARGALGRRTAEAPRSSA